MTSAEIDDYLDALPEPRRSLLAELRSQILAIAPDATEGIAYGAPVFRLKGRPIAGFAAFTGHLSYLPHSGDVVATLGSRLDGYRTSKGAVKFDERTPLTADLVEALVRARLDEIGR